jgi:phosphatidylethanolamine/phosphatidyl-N-methylethanolamine N-methyltransferase
MFSRFLLQYLRSPATVGAIAPSSSQLARSMSRLAKDFESILELGAGTGPITRQLATDHGESRLVVFELNSDLARMLALRHPAAQLVDGCVHERVGLFQGRPARTVIVSSLPFRSLPAAVVRPTVQLLEDFLLEFPDRKLVQFTYGFRAPFKATSPHLDWTRQQRIWANVPPASVWTLQHRDGRKEPPLPASAKPGTKQQSAHIDPGRYTSYRDYLKERHDPLLAQPSTRCG